MITALRCYRGLACLVLAAAAAAGGRPMDKVCAEVRPGVFARKFARYTVQLDCNSWQASFAPADNAADDVGVGGGYDGMGTSLPK
eukprot:SAG22_NODE_1045_length_5866_cov_1.781516_2_plen_85_part_00